MRTRCGEEIIRAIKRESIAPPYRKSSQALAKSRKKLHRRERRAQELVLEFDQRPKKRRLRRAWKAKFVWFFFSQRHSIPKHHHTNT